jgi:quinol monooxygenase YgiN
VDVVLRKLGKGSRAVAGRLVRAPRKGSVVVIEFPDGMHEYVVAKPGKEEEVAAFLSSALPLAQAEAATIVWFALRLSRNEFGIFDAFPDDAGRKAHLSGPIAAALMAKAGELLAEPPKIEPVDLLAVKLGG